MTWFIGPRRSQTMNRMSTQRKVCTALVKQYGPHMVENQLRCSDSSMSQTNTVKLSAKKMMKAMLHGRWRGRMSLFS